MRPTTTLRQSAQGLVLVLALMMLVSCGFKLRGQVELPPDMAVVYINVGGSPTTPPSALGVTLRRVLEANGVVVTTDPAQAKANLVILRDVVRRRLMAASAGGVDREYTLIYTVDYTVTRADGSPLLAQESVSLSRDLLYPDAAVLGREEGEEIMLNALRDDIARSVLLRLQVAARS
jgi:LPS-assembly lipoprotein